MITFSYQARDASGRIVSGIQDAINEDNAVTSLMSRGLMVLSLQKKSDASRKRKQAGTVKETDVVLFTRQLATMIEAGISLVQVVHVTGEEAFDEACAVAEMGANALLLDSGDRRLAVKLERARRRGTPPHRFSLLGARSARRREPGRWRPPRAGRRGRRRGPPGRRQVRRSPRIPG